jgi:hypothetical protein
MDLTQALLPSQTTYNALHRLILMNGKSPIRNKNGIGSEEEGGEEEE